MKRRANALGRGQPIDDAPSVLDELLPPTLGEALGQVRTVVELGQVLETLHARRQRDRHGVIDLEEVAPGVFAAPKRKPVQPTPIGRLSGIIEDFNHVRRALHGRR
jgi:hypothetical protein